MMCDMWSCRADGPGSSCCCALALRFGTVRPCAREASPSLCHQSRMTMGCQGATCRRSSDPLGLSRHAFSRRRAVGFQLAPRKSQLRLSATRSGSFSIENPTITDFRKKVTETSLWSCQADRAEFSGLLCIGVAKCPWTRSNRPGDGGTAPVPLGNW